MPVIVTTSGPINSLSNIPDPKLGNMERIVQIISDEIDDTMGEYLPQIQEAVFSAIRFCEREPFYFNESRDITFKTNEGQEWYGLQDNPIIADLAGLQAVYCERMDGQRRILSSISISAIETLNDAQAPRGEPSNYIYYNQRLRFYPIPDGEYTIRLQVSPLRLELVKNATDASPWFMDAFDLIKARTKYELYKDILKDAEQASIAFNDYNEQFSALKAETSRRIGTGKICATTF